MQRHDDSRALVLDHPHRPLEQAGARALLHRARRRRGRGCACAPARARSVFECAMNQRELLLAAGLVAEHLRLPFRAAARLERRGRDLLDEMILLEPIGDEIADRADLELMRAREVHQVVEAGHGAVLAHDLADDAAGVETGEPRNVDRRLGMAGARQERRPAARPAGRRGPGETIASGPFAESIATAMVRARSAALMPVEMPSFASIDTVKAVSLRLRLVRVIGSSPSWSARSLVKREADQAAAMARHEVDRVRRRHLRRNDEIALILAAFVVDEDEHASVARLVDDRLGADQHLGVAALDQLFEPARACRRSGSSPAGRPCAGCWGGGRRRGRGRRG